LLLTDSLVSVPAEPPPVLGLDPYPLLFHARDRADEPIQDSPEARRRGWQRIALFAFYFRPSALGVPTLKEAWQAAQQAPDRSRRAYYGLYPFRWRSAWQQSFQALHGGGRPFVAPVLQTLIFNRGSKAVGVWVEAVCRWQFEQAIPCHLTAPIALTPSRFRAAFDFLMAPTASTTPVCGTGSALPDEDFTFLREIEAGLVKRGVTPPRQ
ncbi:MAG: DUF4336 domain-containing protein, partial [Cyanobacteria bacterium]|nr:DUF4336 domain-containing protein [Cyanobacteriota bacterium]